MTPNRRDDSCWTTIEAAVEQELGKPVRIREMVRHPVVTSSSHRLEQIHLHLDHGGDIELFAKDIGPEGLAPAAAIKPPELLDPKREALVYLDPLKTADLGTARCYGAWCEAGSNRTWLLLERVEGAELFQSGEMRDWKSACAWLARLHSRFNAVSPDFPTNLHLLRLDADYLRGRMVAAAKTVFANPSLKAASKSSFLKIRDQYADWIDLSLGSAPTLLHGDFYPANILVAQAGDGSVKICPVDWEMAAWGPGLADLAALVSGTWQPDERRELAAAYLEEAERMGMALPPHFWTALEAWRLHVAVQWIGWSADWRPPPEQRHDWLTEAIQIVAKYPEGPSASSSSRGGLPDKGL